MTDAGRRGADGRQPGRSCGCHPRAEEFCGKAEFGAWFFSPHRFANKLAFQPVVIGKIAHAIAEPAQKQPARRYPVADEIGWLIDDGEAEAAAGKDNARLSAPPARIEVVAVEKEQHHAGPPDLLEQWIKARRIQAPGVVVVLEVAKRGWRSRHHSVDIIRIVCRHQGEKRAEGLAGQNDAPIAPLLELGREPGQDTAAPAQGVVFPQPVEAKHIPA